MITDDLGRPAAKYRIENRIGLARTGAPPAVVGIDVAVHSGLGIRPDLTVLRPAYDRIDHKRGRCVHPPIPDVAGAQGEFKARDRAQRTQIHVLPRIDNGVLAIILKPVVRQIKINRTGHITVRIPAGHRQQKVVRIVAGLAAELFREDIAEKHGIVRVIAVRNVQTVNNAGRLQRDNGRGGPANINNGIVGRSSLPRSRDGIVLSGKSHRCRIGDVGERKALPRSPVLVITIAKVHATADKAARSVGAVPIGFGRQG